MITEAIILAGGLGTRLRQTIPDLPKCMAPVAGHPFIKYVIDYYSNQGIQRFIFSLGYMHDVIEEYLISAYSRLDYSCVTEHEPLGTGGAIYNAISISTSESVLVLNGDTLFKVDLRKLSTFHDAKNADCTLSLKELNNINRYGIVETGPDGRITSFKEKSFYRRAAINGGVYALNVESFLSEDLPEKFSFEKDYFEKLYKDRQMYAVVQDGYFIDIGIPEDYTKAQEDFKLFL